MPKGFRQPRVHFRETRRPCHSAPTCPSQHPSDCGGNRFYEVLFGSLCGRRSALRRRQRRIHVWFKSCPLLVLRGWVYNVQGSLCHCCLKLLSLHLPSRNVAPAYGVRSEPSPLHHHPPTEKSYLVTLSEKLSAKLYETDSRKPSQRKSHRP